MSNSARLQLGFSPLSKTIMLAKMRDVEGGRMRVGNDPGRDVTNEAAQLVWRLVMAEGGEIAWELDDGSRMVLKAEKQEATSEQINYQALREAAEKALHGEWGHEAGAIWNTCDSGYVQHMAAVEAGDDVSDEEHMSNMRFITLATPTVVLGLLDELSEAKAAEENESSCANSVIDIAINWQMRAKDAEAKLEAAEKRIAELELREVVLPQCYSMLHRVDFDEPYHTEMVYRQHQVLEALHNAGINVTEAGKGEAS